MDLLIKKFFLKRKKKVVKPKEQLAFLKRLYRLLQRGYSLSEALDVIAWDERLQKATEQIHTTVLSGKPFDEALKQAHFHPLIVLYIYFVRIHGNLVTSLQKSIELFEQRLQTIESFKKTSRYPLILIIIFILLFLLIHYFIFPAYEEMFHSYTEAYATVQFTFFLYRICIGLFFSTLLAIVILTILWKLYKNNIPLSFQLRLFSYIPIYRSFIKLQTSFYFATHISMFLKAGLSMNQIIQHLATQEELPIVQHYATLMLDHVGRGYYLDQLLHRLTFIDDQLATLFQRHHNLDGLQKDLSTYADFAQEYLQERMMQAIMYIQPIAYSLLGSFIIMIYLSLLWPMFQLIDAI